MDNGVLTKFIAFASLFFGLLLSTENIAAQKEDYVWLTGYDSQDRYDSGFSIPLGITITNFNYNPKHISYDSLGMAFSRTDISYCDTAGNLLFYSNGVYIANSLNDTIDNSFELNAGFWMWDLAPTIQTNGYVVMQGMIALPNPGNNNQYYLIHNYGDTIQGEQIRILKTLATLLDMSADSGRGQVIYKNAPLIQDTVDTPLSATKHSNGRDWWILVKEIGTNCFYRILIDSSGPTVLPEKSCLGRPDYLEIAGASQGSEVFSPNGNKFVHSSVGDGVTIYDFNRCTGDLSNPVFIPIDSLDQGVYQVNSVSISSNSRFLYVALDILLLQYDLSAVDIPSSVDTVGRYDGYTFDSVSALQAHFFSSQLAPDGKIYLSCGNGLPFFHVINNPDLKGDSCSFIQRGDTLITPSAGIPNFPNYRLGSQSVCDSANSGLQVHSTKESLLRIFPNPTNSYLIVDYGFTDWSKASASLDISNTFGQTVYHQELPMYSGFQKLDVSRLASGLYTVSIKRQNAIVSAGKFIKE